MKKNAARRPVIFVVGNPLLPSDSMPLRLLPLLQKACPNLNIHLIEPTRQDIPQNRELVFIDTVQGIKKVAHFHGLDALQSSPAFSLHDFDLGMQLKLMEKFGLLKSVHIIGVPAKGKKEKITKDVVRELGKL